MAEKNVLEVRSDTSDECDLQMDLGDIDYNWYDEYEHYGYDLSGLPIAKTLKTDAIDEFLAQSENPDYWTEIYDPKTGRKQKMTAEQMEVLRRVARGVFPDKNMDAYSDYVDWATSEKLDVPLSKAPMRKAEFLPPKNEIARINKLVLAIKEGRISTDGSHKKNNRKRIYDVWGDNNFLMSSLARWRSQNHWQAPKLPLPSTMESYNIPEYLAPTEKDVENYNNMSELEKSLYILPKKYDCLRHVPSYERLLSARYNRLLDLYLCPRQQKNKVVVDHVDDLLPELPSLDSLRPFPSFLSGRFEIGNYMETEDERVCGFCGSEDGELYAVALVNRVLVYDTRNNRLQAEIDVSSKKKNNNNTCVAFAPRTSNVLLVGKGHCVFVVYLENINDYSEQNNENILGLFKDGEVVHKMAPKKFLASKNETFTFDGALYQHKNYKYTVIDLTKKFEVQKITFHSKGDYFNCAVKETKAQRRCNCILVQVSKRRFHQMFSKPKQSNFVSCIFNKTSPELILCLDSTALVYDLIKNTLICKFKPNLNRVTAVAEKLVNGRLVVAFGGDDGKVVFYDRADMTGGVVKPLKSVKSHRDGAAALAFDSNNPLFASAGADKKCALLHCSSSSSSYGERFSLLPVKLFSEAKSGLAGVFFNAKHCWLYCIDEAGSIFIYH